MNISINDFCNFTQKFMVVLCSIIPNTNIRHVTYNLQNTLKYCWHFVQTFICILAIWFLHPPTDQATYLFFRIFVRELVRHTVYIVFTFYRWQPRIFDQSVYLQFITHSSGTNAFLSFTVWAFPDGNYFYFCFSALSIFQYMFFSTTLIPFTTTMDN